MERTRVVIMGAAGRDFHDFNVRYRDDASSEVVAFTAAQIPNIEGRRYPAALAGALYPEGIPIVPESQLAELVRENDVRVVVLAYSDLAHEDVMHKASLVLAAGASFTLLGPRETMLASRLPVLSVCAVRTGAGKSAVSRYVAKRLAERGHRVAVLRHPMPYGDLEKQAAQRFATLDDLDAADCTIEEREEYEPHLRAGAIVHAGVDYARVLAAAEKDAGVIVWDGGNNDFPFVQPDLHIVLVDPRRPGHETRYHPGETNLRMADVVLVSKAGRAKQESVQAVKDAARRANPRAEIILGDLAFRLEGDVELHGRSALIIEDGPTTTHGGMAYGAGFLAARDAGATPVDPRAWAVGSIARAYDAHPHLAEVLPALGYDDEQLDELRRTIDAVPCDVVVDASPVDLERLIPIAKPVARVEYEYADLDHALDDRLLRFEEVMTPGARSQRRRPLAP